MTLKDIAILGAGPGGLTLARILQLNGLHPTIFERDITSTSRSQGGMLDLHAESGLRALKEGQLLEAFKQKARYGAGEQTRIVDKHGVTHLDDDGTHGPPPEGGEDRGRPEIDRGDLRDILLASVDKHSIKWAYNVCSAEQQPDGKFILTLDGRTPATGQKFDLVVGADGASSRVRPLVSSATPQYCGIIYAVLTLSECTRFPEICKLVGQGTAFILGGSHALVSQTNGRKEIRTYACIRTDEGLPWLEKQLQTQGKDPASVRDFWVRQFKEAGFKDEVLDLLRHTNLDSIDMRAINVLPHPHTWKHRDGVTLIGDAAHLMSPFAGEGVNLAMLDAAELAAAIVGVVREGVSQSEALSQFEEGMLTRGAAAAEESQRNLEIIFTKDAPKTFVELMQSYGPPPE